METFIRQYSVKDLEQCKNAVNWFEDNIDKALPGRVLYGTREIMKEYKESLDMSIILEDLYNIPCFQHILDCLWEAVLDYVKEFTELSWSSFSLIEHINIQKYTPPTGGFKGYHSERGCLTSSTRFLVWMVYLNTLTDKGGTEFKYLNHIEDAIEGKILIWPPDFTHTHRGVVSPTQEKYILTGWYNLIN